MIKDDILALYELFNGLAMDLVGKDHLLTGRRERRALELITESHQCLFAACINLDLIQSGHDPG